MPTAAHTAPVTVTTETNYTAPDGGVQAAINYADDAIYASITAVDSSNLLVANVAFPTIPSVAKVSALTVTVRVHSRPPVGGFGSQSWYDLAATLKATDGDTLASYNADPGGLANVALTPSVSMRGADLRNMELRLVWTPTISGTTLARVYLVTASATWAMGGGGLLA